MSEKFANKVKNFNQIVKEKLSDLKNVKIYFREEKSDDVLGNLQGFDIENEKLVGYFYYWEKGFLDYSLVDLETGNFLIETKIIPFDESKIEEILRKLLVWF